MRRWVFRRPSWLKIRTEALISPRWLEIALHDQACGLRGDQACCDTTHSSLHGSPPPFHGAFTYLKPIKSINLPVANPIRIMY